jgi:anti-anti-sigma factor
VVPEQPDLRMSVRRTSSAAVLALAGEADIATASRLQMRVRALLDDGLDDVVVDARELDFLDLAALQVLLDAADELRDRGGSLVLREPRRRVRRLLDVTGTAGQLLGER